ncbi:MULTISPECIES: SSI family serine proteinase inhibitor [unclassified Nonomuraea]|uniref:SSI family serine proteinase inhibitor n=1 Tax=unclassified Nonomuraea TaxID=2593643 RepID=UPI0034093541
MTSVLTAARRTAALALCASAALIVPFGASPAGAAAADEPGVLLFITVTPSNGGGAYSMRLTCDPDGGTHPRPRTACAELHEVDGVIKDLNVDPGACPRNYAPVSVHVSGHWYGRTTSYDRKFENDCVMERTLGPLVK